MQSNSATSRSQPDVVQSNGDTMPGVGGQAVIEGVMMRMPAMIATAVRRASGEIVVKKEPYRSFGERFPLFKLPVLRGAVGLVEMMIIGIRTLNYSAEIAAKDMDESGKTNGHRKKKQSPLDEVLLGVTVLASLAFGVAIFFATPLLLTTTVFRVDQNPLWFNLIAGGIRIAFLLAYLGLISMMKDVKRLFQYHGAEHKAVFAFEHGEGLEVAAAARHSRFHPRCGTSFLLIVMFVAVFLFSIVDAVIIAWLGEISLVARLLTHLPLIPLVGGVSYEVIRASAKRRHTVLANLAIAPGLWLQKITTQEPDQSQLEVALVALRCALERESTMTSTVRMYLPQEPTLN